MTIAVFIIFAATVLAVSTYTSRRSRGIGGYFAANNSIPWGVNGIAFAGSYLSVASFLGICGLIAFHGFDGFLYSIGFLAGWVIALFVIAEPMKRMGTFTFPDALNRNFKSPGIHLAAGFSVLVVSLFYLVPQMVGAGVLIEPLLGIPHYWGVIIIGGIVILIVAGGGMTSTSYVQFFNGGLLLIFAVILAIAVLVRGVSIYPQHTEEGIEGLEQYRYEIVSVKFDGDTVRLNDDDMPGAKITGKHSFYDRYTGKENLVLYRIARRIPAITGDHETYTAFIKGRTPYLPVSSEYKNYWNIEEADGEMFIRIQDWWRLMYDSGGEPYLLETQSRTVMPHGGILVNGVPEGPANRLRQMGGVSQLPEAYGESSGPIGPLRLLSMFSDSSTVTQLPKSAVFTTANGAHTTVHYTEPVSGDVFMRPGLRFPLEKKEGEPPLTTLLNRLNFISLMLALFLGTAALPHILIRYYTVPDVAAARKSTIVAIAGIGVFYVTTMYLGIGALASGALNPATSNMSAPLLARSFGEILFAMISGIAFTTVLATVSGLIMASAGAVAHDIIGSLVKKEISDKAKIRAGRITSVVVGILGISLGIAFRGMNVSFLVGWAFAVAASANLPALILMLFWKKTTAKGIIASILVGVFSSVGLILLSPDMWSRYGFDAAAAPMPLNQPGIISIPLSFAVLIIVSLMTQKNEAASSAA